MPPPSTHRRWLLGAALPLLLLAATLASCVSIAGGASRTVTPSPLGIPTFPPEGPEADVFLLIVVSFHSSTGFTGALQSVTNLGLQPVENCTSYQYSDARWQSQDERLRFSSAAQLPLPAQLAPTLPPNSPPQMAPTLRGQPWLEVIPTPLAPHDWLQRLAALPNVVTISTDDGMCSLTREDRTPVPGVRYFLGERAWAEDVRVQFAATGASGSGVGYGAALATISGLGFRLADPCYEESLPPPPWRPMGQQASFASSGALVVALTAANSTAWLAQLKAAAGVVSVQAPYTQTCAMS